MNAPFKTSSIGGRDPFSGFVCDDMTLDVVRSVCDEMGWSQEKACKGGLRNAVQSLSVASSPQILLVDLSESGDPISDINSLAEVCEPGTVVIALGQVNDVRLYRDLLMSGLQDYLLKPLSPDALRDALAHANTILHAPKADDTSGDQMHVSTAVIGMRGGVGGSTIAACLAWAYSNQLSMTTGLLDLDIHFGTGALIMDLEPGRGLADAIDNPSRIDGLFIERAMIKASEKLSILSAEAPINSPIMTDGTAFFQLQEEFRAAFENTVIDLPRHMLIAYPHLLQDVGAVVLVCELTLAGARDMIRLLAWLKSNAPKCKVFVILNKMQTISGEISRKDFEITIEQKIDVVIPFDPKSMAEAAKIGKPIVEAVKGSKVSVAIAGLATDIQSSFRDDTNDGLAGGKTNKKSGGGMMALFSKKTEKKTKDAA
jgi:pilus assembly protein CpaE